MPFPKAMADIYARLKPLGFDARFLRAAVLPDWWEDELADVPFNRSWAEMAISRQLGIPLDSLRSHDAQLVLPPMVALRLKSATRGTSANQIRPSIQIAQRVARLIVQSVLEFPPFDAPDSPAAVREEILAANQTVTLDSLLEFCWSHGIVVAHLDRLPNVSGYRKFDGIVMFADSRPCILLAEAKDSPPILAFHLAHELGHLLLQHVYPGSELLADDNLERIVSDEIEDAADHFANEVLSGESDPQLNAVYGLTGDKLAAKAVDFGIKYRIDPGVITQIYGRSADRWGPAMIALKSLNLNTGARRIIHRRLKDHLDLDRLADDNRGFLEALVLSTCDPSEQVTT